MIDLNLHVAAIEKLMKLMKRYNLDELSVDFVNIKRTPDAPKRRAPRRAPRRAEADDADQTFLDAYTVPPVSNEPWNDIDQSAVDEYSVTGRIAPKQ